jgi:hypothetical protein
MLGPFTCRLEGVLKHYMQDFAARMKQIKESLDAGLLAAGPSEKQPSSSGSQPGGQSGDHTSQASREGTNTTAEPTQQGGGSAPAASTVTSPAEMEGLLEELMDIVSSIDYARGG